MSILYLMIIDSEEFAIQLTKNKNIDILTHVCTCLIHVDVDMNFMALQVCHSTTILTYCSCFTDSVAILK
jgi:hypothetical protein